MKLKTKVDVTCCETGSVKPYTGKVIGVVLVSLPKEDGGLAVSMEYQKYDTDSTFLMNKTVSYTKSEVETLYQAIKGELTPGLNGVKSLNEQILFGFIIEMAQTFNIPTTDIEIIA